MIQITKDELKPGMVLARSIYRENGELLLADGYELEAKLVRKLKTLEFPYYWIQEHGTESVIPPQIISDLISIQSQAAVRENTQLLKEVNKVHEETYEGIQKSMRDTSRFKNVLLASQVKKSVGEIIDELLEQQAAMVNLSSIRTKGNYLYQHSLDVTVTAIILANKLKFNRQEIEQLALGCMLMDFGMVVIPDNIVNKTERLTFQEYSVLKEHTTYGFFILRENEKIPLVSAHVAYQHHERQDGAGYPRGLKGQNQFPIRKVSGEKGAIHRYAEIASVVDTYVALISPRPQTNFVPKSPEQAIRSLITAASSQLNRTIVDTFITLIPVYPLGTRIVIVTDEKYRMTGYTGIVSQYRQEHPDKPSVMILFNKKKEKIKPVLIDLMEEPQMKIQFVILS